MVFIIVFILKYLNAMPPIWPHRNEWLYASSYDELVIIK